jgi:hypothetical protein
MPLKTKKMKTFSKLKLIGMVMVLISSFSCSNSDRPDGDWDDNIKLSQKEAKLTSENDSIVITTEGEGWWINGVRLNGNSDFEVIENSNGQFLIDENEFKVDRRSSKELYIEMSNNTSGSERTLIISIQNGDYFDGIKITQSTN